MTAPTEPPLTDPGDPARGIYPSKIIMVDAAGNLTTDPSQARSGEVIESLPDGSTRSTAFTA